MRASILVSLGLWSTLSRAQLFPPIDVGGGVDKYWETDGTGGSGPYKAYFRTDPDLPDHTIYAPEELPEGVKLPVIAWGNGGCIAKGTYFINFLINLASHGFVIAAPGEPEPRRVSQSDPEHLTQTLDWAERANRSGQFAGHLDTTKLAIAGQSCGGVEAIEIAAEEGDRLTAIGIFNSGLLNIFDTPKLRRLKNPIAYFLGGPTDIAYRNGERDYDNLPRTLPAWKGNLPVGHFATFAEKQGGKFGVAAVNYFKWQLYGDEEARNALIGNPPGLEADGWDIEYKNF
ncbi:hypothetical protein VTO42DRAFT_4290 [Malbranchea cinnamomea]